VTEHRAVGRGVWFETPVGSGSGQLRIPADCAFLGFAQVDDPVAEGEHEALAAAIT